MNNRVTSSSYLNNTVHNRTRDKPIAALDQEQEQEPQSKHLRQQLPE
jgi:hypothetical protein